jgi:hypothetical protein
VSEAPPLFRALNIVSFSATRRLLRESHARMMVVFFALLYGLGSMVLGGMLLITPVRGGYGYEFLWGNALGQGSWNYPGFLLVEPWGILTLPFLATWSMIFVSVGVGVGISVGVLVAVRLVRERRRAAAAPGTVASVAGLTPAMIALVTLGACCSTTAAATAGVGLVAQASGTSVSTLLVNNWYLDVFQVTVVVVALFAQELVLEVYGGLLRRGVSDADFPVAGTSSRGSSREVVIGGLLRAALLLAGVTWSLAMVAEWTTISPYSAGPVLWFQWIAQHQIPAVLAILAAMFPRAVANGLARLAAPGGRALRMGLAVAGGSLALWTPAVLASGGAPGFLNELFSTWGLPTAFAPVAPVFVPGVTLYLRWAFQYLLLGGFALAVAIEPKWIARPLRASLGSAAPHSEDSTFGRDSPESAPRFPALDRPVGRVDSAGILSQGPEP